MATASPEPAKPAAAPEPAPAEPAPVANASPEPAKPAAAPEPAPAEPAPVANASPEPVKPAAAPGPAPPEPAPVATASPEPAKPAAAPEPAPAEPAPEPKTAAIAPSVSASEALRARLAETLKGYSCARLEQAEGADGTRVSGFVSTDGDLRRLRDQAAGEFAPLKTRVDASVRPWPYCEAIVHLDAHASRASGVAPDSGIATNHPDRRYRDGDSFTTTITVPGSGRRYLFVAYLTSTGEAVRLYPTGDAKGLVSGGDKVVLGGDGTFRVSAPFGRDMLIALAGDAPFATRLGTQWKSARAFLDDLSYVFYDAPDAHFDGRYVFIDTSR